MELKDLVKLYRGWIWLLIAGLVLGMACGFVVSKTQTPVYEASTKTLVARSQQQVPVDVFSLSDQQLVATYQQLLKTQQILDAAGSKLGASIDPDHVRVEVLPNTQIIQITVEDTNAGRAAAIANALAQVLIDQNEILQAGRYAAYQEGVNTQTAQVQQQINDLQGQIRRLDQANIQEQLTQVNRQITSLQDEIVSLEKDIAKLPDAYTSTARANLAEKQAQVTQLRSLLSLYLQIQTNLTYIGQPVNGTTLNDPQIASLQSTLSLYQQLYLSLLNSLEAVKLARAQSTPTVTQIEEAVPPKDPIRPLPLLYTVWAGMVGLLIAGAAVLLVDYFDDSVKSASQIQELLRAPVIGQISDSSAERKWYEPAPRGNLERPLLDNAFGALRVNLRRIMTGKDHGTILVTSTSHGEGKTTVAVGLAQAFAQSGKHVLILDADFRHPQIHARFNIDNQMGLVDILTTGVDWQEVSARSDGVTVITSGMKSATQEALLESDKMLDLLERLQRKADIVILDGPPLFLVSAQVLASRVGGVLLVIQQGETHTSTVRALKEQLDLMGVSLLGVVMNRVPPAETYYYDGYFTASLEDKPEEELKEPETP